MLNLGNKTPQIKKHERGADELSGIVRKNETYVQMEFVNPGTIDGFPSTKIQLPTQ